MAVFGDWIINAQLYQGHLNATCTFTHWVRTRAPFDLQESIAEGMIMRADTGGSNISYIAVQG